MATASTLFTNRDTAGATYAAAVVTLQNAWVALRALDLACQNSFVIAAHPSGARLRPVETLGNPSDLQSSLVHPVYGGPAVGAVAGWQRTAEANALAFINGLG